MVENPAPAPSRSLRIRFLLYLADRVYDWNVAAFDFVGRVSAWWSVFVNNRYTDVSTWCWKVLVIHGTTEEAIAVGNRRLARYGLQLVHPDAVKPPVPAPALTGMDWGNAATRRGDLN